MPLIRNMKITDYTEVVGLMLATPGVAVRDADSRDATARYLARNPGLSFVAEDEGKIVACLMAGHDGRRGYLQHLLVAPQWRRQGLARQLIFACTSALAREGIDKSHIAVFTDNADGIACWEALGWQQRTDTYRYSFTFSGNSNA